jgi:Fungal protein kinase
MDVAAVSGFEFGRAAADQAVAPCSSLEILVRNICAGSVVIYMAEDSCGYDSCPNTEADNAARIVERIRHEFGNNWRQDDSFLEKFFPICPTWEPHIEATQRLHYNMKTSRWKRIPKAPNVASKLYTPLRVLMNDILLQEEESRQPSSHRKGTGYKTSQRKSAHRYEWRTQHIRTVLATHAKNKRVHTHPHSPVSPSLYLAGGGSQIMGIGAPLIKANGLAGIAPIEVILDSDDVLVARDRLATNVSQMFCDQSARRFAFGLIMTETTCRVYMFDHSGAVVSHPFNYHQQPSRLCAIMFRLGCDQCDLLGFDSSVFLERSRGGIVIRTLVDSGEGTAKPVFYIMDIDGDLFRFSTLIGPGTVCWRTRKEGQPGSRYVVKEAWIPFEELPGRESEGSLLRYAQARGVASGVAQIEHFEEVRRSDGPGDLDTVLRNRQIDNPTLDESKVERIHTRMVLKTYGKPLNMFATRKELLLAFHDAVLGVLLPLTSPMFSVHY